MGLLSTRQRSFHLDDPDSQVHVSSVNAMDFIYRNTIAIIRSITMINHPELTILNMAQKQITKTHE